MQTDLFQWLAPPSLASKDFYRIKLFATSRKNKCKEGDPSTRHLRLEAAWYCSYCVTWPSPAVAASADWLPSSLWRVTCITKRPSWKLASVSGWGVQISNRHRPQPGCVEKVVRGEPRPVGQRTMDVHTSLVSFLKKPTASQNTVRCPLFQNC